MAEEPGSIIVSLDDDTDNGVSDDEDEQFSEHYGSEDTITDTSSDGYLTLDSELEVFDNSFEEQYLHDIRDEYDDDSGACGDEEDDSEDGEEYHFSPNLQVYRTSSVDFPPMNIRRQPSVPDDFLVYCEEPLIQTEQANQSQDNPVGTISQPVAEAEPENLVFRFTYSGKKQGRNTVFLKVEMTGIAEASVGNLMLTTNNLTFEENHEEEVTFNPPVIHSFHIPVISETFFEDDPDRVNYSLEMENSSGQQKSPSSVQTVSESEIEEVVLVALPQKSEFIVDGNKETVYYPAILGHVVPRDAETIAASISSGTEINKLVLREVPVDQLNFVDNNPETLNYPFTPESGGDQEPAAPSHVSSETGGEENNYWTMDNLYVLENYSSRTMPCFVSVRPGLGVIPETNPQIVNCPTSMEPVNDLILVSDQEGYLGDPRRNIRLPNFHLEIARNKPIPSYAACYLANLIFSEEIRRLTSVSGLTSHNVIMDNSKLSAIREHLLTIFPNCDLSEQGKDWIDCLSAISFMIGSLYTEVEIPTDRNFSMPISTDWNIRNGDNEGEGPSQWLQEVRESVIRESRLFEHNASAKPEGTDNTAVIHGELVHLGNPSRNIKIPYSVLKIAKGQLRPDLSAKFITLHLFPEEILIRSTVYGNLECGLFALDSNRIDALQEFLQENYPEYDLEEPGYYWKLSVIAINSCLQILRQGLRNDTVLSY